MVVSFVGAAGFEMSTMSIPRPLITYIRLPRMADTSDPPLEYRPVKLKVGLSESADAGAGISSIEAMRAGVTRAAAVRAVRRGVMGRPC